MAESMEKSDSSIIVALELLILSFDGLSSELEVYTRNGKPLELKDASPDGFAAFAGAAGRDGFLAAASVLATTDLTISVLAYGFGAATTGFTNGFCTGTATFFTTGFTGAGFGAGTCAAAGFEAGTGAAAGFYVFEMTDLIRSAVYFYLFSISFFLVTYSSETAD
jgi:hypothetical protein